jgi:hypothetical protein
MVEMRVFKFSDKPAPEKVKKSDAEWARAIARDPKLKKAWEEYLRENKNG